MGLHTTKTLSIHTHRNWGHTLYLSMHTCKVAAVESYSTCGLQPARPLCPLDSLGRTTGEGCRALLQGTFWQWDCCTIICLWLFLLCWEWLCSSLSTSLTVPQSLLFFPLSSPFNSFLLVLVIHLGKILALAESLALNAQSYSMPFFLVCKSTNQHIIVCSPQLFSLLLSIHWLFSKDISPPACNLNLEFSWEFTEH